jgi:hypothetical protein
MGLNLELKDQPEIQHGSTPEHSPAVEARIEHIADLMRQLSYKYGSTVPRLAKRWGYTDQYVRLLAVEAGKRVRAELTDPDRVTTTVCAYVEWALETAKENGEVRAIAPLAKAWAELAGTLVQKHEVTGGGVIAAGDPETQADIYEAAARALRSGKEGA